MTREVLVFSHSTSNRLQYIIDLLSRYFGLPFKLIFDEERYLDTPSLIKINYSYHRLQPGEIFIHSHVLLFETTVRPVKIDCFEHNNYKAFFKSEGEAGFDIFAATFYLISRYEEYLPYEKDAYGRYGHVNSLAYKENFLHLPLVNIWFEDFRNLLKEKYPQFEDPARAFSFQPTYDIDMAWVYRNKGLKRNAGSILLLLLKLKFSEALCRYRVIKKKMDDPYDAYAWMDQLHSVTGIKPVYFFLMAMEQGPYDKNIDVHNHELVQLIKYITAKYATGLHPSWQSGDQPVLIAKEKNELEKICGQKILNSRQHYIRFHLPFTYRHLTDIGIVHEYSMGYGSINGFRASFTDAYFWFDIKEDKQSALLIHPFCFMDANSFYEQNMSPEKAFEELMHYYMAVKSVNGRLITIWHNSFLGSSGEFKGWKEVYEKFVKTITVPG